MHKYHEHIESNHQTYDVGKYEYRSRILKKTKTVRVGLPVGMHQQGLMVLGSKESLRREFLYHYAKTLIAAGKKVLFITDVLTESRYEAHEESQTLYRHIGTKGMADGEVCHTELTGEYNMELFENGAKLVIVQTNTHEKMMNSELYQDYDSKLLKLLEGVVVAGQKNRDAATEMVIFLDEDCYSSVLNRDTFSNLVYDINRLSIGFVVSGFESRRYRGILSQIEHHVFFQIHDPTETVGENIAFNRRCIDWQNRPKNSKYKTQLYQRDLVSLAPRQFYYFRSKLVGFSNLTTFDVDG